MVALKRAPSSATLLSVKAEITKAMNTPRMQSVWDRRRPIQLPPNLVPRMPAARAPASGASGTASRVEALRVWLIVIPCLSLERVEFVDVDVGLVAEQQHQDGQADRRLRRSHRENEEHEH